jgi:pimeloyl-ACP methyl ester carboxylesterase
VATELAAHDGPYAGLVLESTFANAAALVEDASLFVPRSLVTENVFDTRAKIRQAAQNAEGGVLLLHGEADDFVRPANSERLVAAIGPRITHDFVRVPGADHGTVPLHPVYDPRVRAFLR